MKKNGFTLIELIAVLVILSILALMATPNIINLVQSGKEKSFISDVEEMVSTATYMYKIQKSREFPDSYFVESAAPNGHRIYMKNINGNLPKTDPYGYTYDIDNSWIDFIESEETGTKTITAYFKSCKKGTTKCHCIDATDANNIVNNNIVNCN